MGGKYNTIFNERISRTAIVGCYSCTINDDSKQSLIAASRSSVSGDSYQSITLSCDNSRHLLSPTGKNTALFCSSDSDILGTSRNCALMSSTSCDIDDSTQCNILSSNNSEINQANYGSIIASRLCQIQGSSSQSAFISSGNSFSPGITNNAKNCTIIASRSCSFGNNINCAAIIGCDQIQNQGDYSAVMAYFGGTFSYTYTLTAKDICYTSWSMVSDRDEKKNIVPVESDENLIEKICQVPIYRYRFKNEDSTKQLKEGFIAQDVQNIFSDLVSQEHVTYKHIYRKSPTDKIWYHKEDDSPIDLTSIDINTVKFDKNDPLKAKYGYLLKNEKLRIRTRDLETILIMGIQKMVTDYKKSVDTLSKLKLRYEKIMTIHRSKLKKKT